MAAKKKLKQAKKPGPRGAASKKPKKRALAKPAKPTRKATKPGSRAPAPKKSKKVAPKKQAAPKKTIAKKQAAPEKTLTTKQAAAAQATTFAERVENCDAGTQVWFTVAGGIEHAAIQARGSEGSVVILTDAGMTEVVAEGNLFETAEEARAARLR